jgi:hypothetical protein
MRQPLAGLQTVTPAPMSTQSRVQQLEAPAQGLPSWLQPPDGRTQRPGFGEVALQSPEQQSWFR